MKHLNLKKALLAALLILLAACEGLPDVGIDPQILSFTANPSTIEAGESATLAWNIIGGSDKSVVTLTPGEVELERTGSYQATPEETTSYTLSVRDEGSTVTKELTVTVNSGGENPENPEQPEQPENPETPENPEEPENPEPDTPETPEPENPEQPENPENPEEPENPENPEEPEEEILEGSILVTNQAELDALAGVTKIEGFLSISTEAETLDFLPLNNLETVTKSLGLSNNPNLKTIEGFPSLTSVGADQFIGECCGDLNIADNPKLTELKGFEALQNVKYLGISNNDALRSFSGFSGLQEAVIAISRNASLETLPEFESLVETGRAGIGFAGGILIAENPKLKSVNSFSNLELSSGFAIRDNDALTTIAGFESLDGVGSGAEGNDEVAFWIRDNKSLTEITGFENVTGISGFHITDNPRLEKIAGFSRMISGGLTRQGFSISDNPELEEIAGFDALEEVDYYFRLENLPKLTKIPSFNALKTITKTSFDGFYITGTGLSAITGFNSMTTEESIDISGNLSLTQISGFISQETGTRVEVSDNAVLDCSAEPQASLPFLPVGSSGGNLVNCPTN